MLKDVLFVAAGGGLGAALRFSVYLIIKTNHFPLSTLLINIIGSFVLGMVMALGLRSSSLTPAFKLFLATGLCGGFTTFSAFSFENIILIEQGKFALMLMYILASIAGGITAAWCGYKLVYA